MASAPAPGYVDRLVVATRDAFRMMVVDLPAAIGELTVTRARA